MPVIFPSILRRGVLCATLIVLAVVAFPDTAHTQEPAPRDSVGRLGGEFADSLALVMEQMQYMNPFFAQMMQSMMTGILEVLSQPESAEHLATFTRNYYEALMRRGFTSEEALRLTAAVGFPTLGGGGGG
jgi:hypothetical protein